MGGTINLTVRFEDGQQHRLRLNGGAVKKATNNIRCIRGDRGHWEEFIEQGQKGRLAPYMHGLVVVDYQEQFILFMQNNYGPGQFRNNDIKPHPPDDAPPKGVKTDRFRDEFVELFEADRIEKIVLAQTGEHPLTGTTVEQSLCGATLDDVDRLNERGFDPFVFIDYGPELHKLTFETGEAGPMQTIIEGLGFELSDDEREGWQHWQDGNFTY